MGEVKLESVTKVFRDGTRAVSSLDLAVPDGTFMVLVGPSGCGKTTALRMVAGLEQATAGSIWIDGKMVNDLTPKDRDIAMVFQNYALYPHMTVYQNMALSLKLRKVRRTERDRRVHEAAQILGIEDLLTRRPRELSGGQRQRVAMGRALVREPQAFLMDEPLSNLDAKLRVQMRAEILRIQRSLKVTTVYVTHDQTEAMTLGDQVAVMKDGVLQQVDTPQTVYARPANLFVGGFIGSPAMNLVQATLSCIDSDYIVEFGGHRLPVPEEIRVSRRQLSSFVGRQLLLGIRPEDMEDATSAAGQSLGARMRVIADLRENVGHESLLHFEVEAPPVLTEDTRALAFEQGAEGLHQLEQSARDRKSRFVARVNAESPARVGERADIAVNIKHLHFFDPETGEAIVDQGLGRRTASSALPRERLEAFGGGTEAR